MQQHFIQGAAGKIEIRVTRPGTFSAQKPAESGSQSEVEPQSTSLQDWVVLSHPHPVYGGTMNNKVVTSMEKAFQELGMGTVAYNFRGAGASEGEYDNGEGEQADLVKVVEWLRTQVPMGQLVLAGFSFGAYVTLKQAADLKADFVCAVAPPVSMYDFSEIELKQPWLLVQGGQDEVIDAQEVLDWAMKLPSPPDVLWRQEASHFFHRQLVWLKQAIRLSVVNSNPLSR